MRGLKIFTAQFGYKGPSRHDTTVKTNTSVFAPSWDLVNGHKQGKITDEEYAEGYLRLLNNSLLTRKDEWLRILKQKEIVLVCFCGRNNCFCHRYITALFLEKFGAKYMGELNNNTGALIHKDKYLPNVLNQFTMDMVSDHQLPDYLMAAETDLSTMVVDPLAIQGMQASICRDCRLNREAQAWTTRGTVRFGIVPKPGEDLELNSKNVACCESTVASGQREYTCPIFRELIVGYKVGLTSRGTNLDPCKNCTEHVDNGGNCFGDRCPDGPFPIKEGAGIMR